MGRTNVFLEWGATRSKDDCAYIMVQDAIELGKAKIFMGSWMLRNPYVLGWHNESCAKRTMPMFDKLYTPVLSKSGTYIFYTNEKNIAIRNRGFFSRLRNEYDAYTVLVIRNMLMNKRYPEIMGRSIKELKEEFDLIITDEISDAELFDLIYYPDSFSNPIKGEEYEMEFDLCFSGTIKKRENLLNEIAISADEHGVKHDIRLIGGTRRGARRIKNVKFQKYADIIRQDMRANCILEVLQPGQTGLTLRTQEAVCLGKKLLTNNRLISKADFYDPRFIHIFDDTNGIDWEFVKKQDRVEYKNIEKFSPITFFDYVEDELRRKYGDSV